MSTNLPDWRVEHELKVIEAIRQIFMPHDEKKAEKVASAG